MRATGLPAPRRLRLEHAVCGMHLASFRRSRHALVETVPGRPGTPKQVVWKGSTLRLQLERIGYLNIASICSRKHEWGLNTMLHPNFLGLWRGLGRVRVTGLPAPRRLRLEHAWVQARFAECTWPMFGARFRRSRHALVETGSGRPGTPKQVVRRVQHFGLGVSRHCQHLL